MSSTLAAQHTVSRSSYDCAAVRALVHARTQSRRADYLAREFRFSSIASLRAFLCMGLLRVGAHRLVRALMAQVTPGADVFLQARQAAADQLIRDALDREPETQIVILGAGLDTSALRIGAERRAAGLPPGRFFEVDLPSTQADKRAQVERLKSRQDAVYDRHLAYVACDFGRQTLTKVLRDAGFERNLPTVWIWSGVVFYLSEAAARATVAELKRLSAANSRLFFDVVLAEALARPKEYQFARVKARFDRFGEVIATGFRRGSEHVGAWLHEQGLQLERILDQDDMAAIYADSTGVHAPSAGVPWSQLCIARFC